MQQDLIKSIHSEREHIDKRTIIQNILLMCGIDELGSNQEEEKSNKELRSFKEFLSQQKNNQQITIDQNLFKKKQPKSDQLLESVWDDKNG